MLSFEKAAGDMGIDRGADVLLWLLNFLFYRWVASVVHEASHLLALLIVTGLHLPVERMSFQGHANQRGVHPA